MLSGALVLTVLGTGATVWFQNDALSATLKKAEEKESELHDAQKRERRRDEALSSLERDRERLRFLETAVSDSAYVPTLLKQLEEVAVQTHNRVLGVQPQLNVQAPTRLQQRRDPDALEKAGQGGSGEKKEEKKPEPYTPLPIQVTLVGGFQSTQAFVERLTKFPKIVSVEELQLRPHRADAKEKSQGSLLDVEIKLTAFVMKEGVNGARPQNGAMSAAADTGGTH
jgi:Tfp pilus assembly protein PilO